MTRATHILLVVLFLMMLETVFVALSTGYLFVQLSSPLFENLPFFLNLVTEDLLATLRFVLVENPVFIIQSKHQQTGTTVWSMHYFALTLLIHFALAAVMVQLYFRKGPEIKYEARFIVGVVLIAISPLYLFLGSCCSGGPNWIVQTWLLAIVFNPVTSTNATIKFYQSIRDVFVLLQFVSGGLGIYLLSHYWHRPTRPAGFFRWQTVLRQFRAHG